jgi:beta-phosphoglucomutase-like phosphatase (HAD superfamily)
MCFVTGTLINTVRALASDVKVDYMLMMFCNCFIQMPAFWDAWVRLCTQYKLRFSEKRFYQMGGIPVRKIMQMLVDEKPVAPGESVLTVDELVTAKKALSHISVAEVGTPAIDIVVAIAKAYHGKIPMAVASSGFREHVHHSLKSNGIFDLFDAVVTAEDIVNPKPAPDIFLEAAKRLGVDPKFCRGYEDADTGIRALEAAGMEVVDVRLLEGYPHPNPSSEEIGV